MNKEQLRMTDTAIGHIAQLLQVAILTGTDIIDNLRSARFVVNNNAIEVSPEWSELFQQNIQAMMNEASEITASEDGENDSE
tara:strand:- start:1952 stop:2197 length:246 start_codon:yes stop_codon:yes gene_type:complete